jgi:hypothetical protein
LAQQNAAPRQGFHALVSVNRRSAEWDTDRQGPADEQRLSGALGGLFLGRVGNDDAASGLFFSFDALDQNLRFRQDGCTAERERIRSQSPQSA